MSSFKNRKKKCLYENYVRLIYAKLALQTRNLLEIICDYQQTIKECEKILPPEEFEELMNSFEDAEASLEE